MFGFKNTVLLVWTAQLKSVAYFCAMVWETVGTMLKCSSMLLLKTIHLMLGASTMQLPGR